MLQKEEVSPEAGLMTFPGFPVVLVCVDKNIITIAAVSFFSFVKPMVMIGIVPSRYSFELIKKTQDFSLNLPTTELLPAIKYCGSHSGRDCDKFAETGLTPVPGKKITSVFIEECPVSLECKVINEINQGGTHIWFIGEIVTSYVRKDYSRQQAILYWPREYRTVGNILK
ncbi:flavin reductase family protein [Candidatus Hodarchaeum mangrovi]